MLLAFACGDQPESSSAKTPRPGGAASEKAQSVFADIAASSRLDFSYRNGMTGELFFVEMMGGGGALLDYDGDGDLDVFLVQGGPLSPRPSNEEPVPTDRLFRSDLTVDAKGRRTLRFVDVTRTSGLSSTGYGTGVITGDFDNDGATDLYVLRFGNNQLLHNHGDGTFEDRTSQSRSGDRRWSAAASVLDFDSDGWLDLFVGNYVDFSLANHRPCRSESGALDYCSPQAYLPEPDLLLRNRGDGSFENVTGVSGLATEHGPTLGVVSADFDGDGLLDLYVANDGEPNLLWQNQGGGRFRNLGLLAGCSINAEARAEASMGVDAGDFDNDGDEDLFMTHLQRETNTLFINDGFGQFLDRSVSMGLAEPSIVSTGFGVAWLDFDLDGWLDLVTVNGAVTHLAGLAEAGDPYPLRQPNQLFRNKEGTGFEEVREPSLSRAEVSRGAAVGDLDDDGTPDLLIVNSEGPVRLLLNRSANDAHWLGVRLLGPGGRDDLGAWARVERPGGPTGRRRARTDGSFASGRDPRILIGLGSEPDIDRLVVRWPDGSQTAWISPKVDRYLIATRPSRGIGAR